MSKGAEEQGRKGTGKQRTQAHLWSSAAAAVLWLVLALAFLSRGAEELGCEGAAAFFAPLRLCSPTPLLSWALALENALAAVLFIVRRPAQRTAGPGPFLLALAVTIGPLLFEHGCEGAEELGGILSDLFPCTSAQQLVGLVLELMSLPWITASLLFLGPAIGMAPADRGLRTGGTYLLVRHPLYAGELFCALGYVVSNASWRNILLWLALLAGQLLRIRSEERLLHACYPQAYAAYCRRVRCRLLPGVF